MLPESPAAHVCMAQALLTAGEEREALDSFQEALKRDPSNHAVARMARKLEHELGRLAVEAEIETILAGLHGRALPLSDAEKAAQYNRLERLMLQAVRDYPETAMFPHYLSKALREQGKHEAALRAVEQALQVFPDAYRLWLELGDTQRAMGELETAGASYAKAAHYAKNDPTPHSAWGQTLVELQQFREAIPVLRAALDQRDPSDQGGQDRVALLRCYNALGLHEEAEWEIARCRELCVPLPPELPQPAAAPAAGN